MNHKRINEIDKIIKKKQVEIDELTEERGDLIIEELFDGK
jgi:hypothetical protein